MINSRELTRAVEARTGATILGAIEIYSSSENRRRLVRSGRAWGWWIGPDGIADRVERGRRAIAVDR